MGKRFCFWKISKMDKGESMKYELNDNKISTLMHVNALLKREKQTERIEDARELLKFVIWQLEKENT